jgi:hypothetical protein
VALFRGQGLSFSKNLSKGEPPDGLAKPQKPAAQAPSRRPAPQIALFFQISAKGR